MTQHRLEVGRQLVDVQAGSAGLARGPSSTMRILSSAEKCRRVARQISFTTRSAGAFGADFFKEDLGFILWDGRLPQSGRAYCHSDRGEEFITCKCWR